MVKIWENQRFTPSGCKERDYSIYTLYWVMRIFLDTAASCESSVAHFS